MNLGVDGDFLCYFQAHAMQSKQTGKKLEEFTLDEFVQHALRTLNYYTSRLFDGKVSNIIFFFDEGKSWRHDFLNSHNITYKDRDKSKRELVNFNDYRNHFRKVLTEYKFSVVAISGYEADDVLYVSSQMFEVGEFCIFTGDSDLQQMLNCTDKKEVWIVNPLDKQGSPFLRTVHQVQSKQAAADFFAEELPSKFIDTVSNIKYVDPVEKLYVKMLCGDSSDTIPSAFQYVEAGKTKTVGETRAEKFHREINPAPTMQDIRNLYQSPELRIELTQRMLSYAKLKSFNKINDFERALHRNIKCILLDDIIYEKDVLESLKNRVSEQSKSSPGANLGNIFRGTPFDFATNYYKY